MASFVMRNAWIWVDGKDLSASSTRLQISTTADVVENSTFSASVVTRIGGLKAWTASLDYIQDTSSSPASGLFAKVGGTVVTFKAKNDSAATSSTNPCYQGNCLVTGINPHTGAVGEVSRGTVSFQGVGELVRSEVTL